MNVQKMMRLDRWLGVPLCFALSCHPSVLPAPRATGSVRSILFIKLAEQGSTVLAHRALQEAVRRVGREHVYMAVFEDNRFILDALGVIPPENVITVQSDSFVSLLRTVLPAIARLRRLRLDAAIDLEFFARSSALLTCASWRPLARGIPCVVWRRAVSRRPDVAPRPLQSTPAHDADFRLACPRAGCRARGFPDL